MQGKATEKERETMTELTTQELWALYFQLCDKGAALLKQRDLEAEAANYEAIQKVKRELAGRPEVATLRM